MAWGDILSDPAVWGNVGGSLVGGTTGTAISFLGNLTSYKNNKDKSTAAQNDYYSALAQQKQLAALAANIAKSRAGFEDAMRTRLLTQTSDMGTNLRAAQTAMGAMPQFNPGTVTHDYAANKASAMTDFTDMIKLVESQGRAGQQERLGGADSLTADSDRMRSLVKQYAPELQRIDDNAWNSAVNKATNTMGLYNTSRQNTLNEIQGLYEPQIKDETALFSASPTELQTGTNSASALANETGDLATNYTKTAGQSQQTLSEGLGALLSQIYNKPAQGTTNNNIYWNGPRVGGA